MSNDAKKYLDSEGLSHFWDKIKDYVGEAVESGTSNIANKIHFVVPNEKEATEALTAAVSDVDALSPGLVVALRMPFDSVASQTLNINNLGAKPIYYRNNTTDAGVFPSGAIVLLVYETTSVGTGCFKAVYSYDGAQPDVYQGATSSSSGIAGLVPAALSEEKDRFLKGDGTWADVEINAEVASLETDIRCIQGTTRATKFDILVETFNSSDELLQTRSITDINLNEQSINSYSSYITYQNITTSLSIATFNITYTENNVSTVYTLGSDFIMHDDSDFGNYQVDFCFMLPNHCICRVAVTKKIEFRSGKWQDGTVSIYIYPPQASVIRKISSSSILFRSTSSLAPGQSEILDIPSEEKEQILSSGEISFYSTPLSTLQINGVPASTLSGPPYVSMMATIEESQTGEIVLKVPPLDISSWQLIPYGNTELKADLVAKDSNDNESVSVDLKPLLNYIGGEVCDVLQLPAGDLEMLPLVDTENPGIEPPFYFCNELNFSNSGDSIYPEGGAFSDGVLTVSFSASSPEPESFTPLFYYGDPSGMPIFAYTKIDSSTGMPAEITLETAFAGPLVLDEFDFSSNTPVPTGNTVLLVTEHAEGDVLTYRFTLYSGSGEMKKVLRLYPSCDNRIDLSGLIPDITDYQGATESASGVAGLVPAATSAQKGNFLKGDGTWAAITLPDGATASEIQTGTVTTAKTVSPKILHDYVAGEVASGVAGLVNSAPATLDTLNELATALGNDPNFATTISGQIGGKLDASSADYIKSLSISGQTITVTKGDNTTGTLTTQDTTYSAGTGLDLSGTTFSVASTAGTSTLAWNSEVTLGTVGGLAIKAKLPVNPDTHKTTHLYVGASGATANAATTTNTTTFLSVVDDTTASDSIQITGSGGASVTAAAGVITIDVPEVSSITNAQIDAMFA